MRQFGTLSNVSLSTSVLTVYSQTELLLQLTWVQMRSPHLVDDAKVQIIVPRDESPVPDDPQGRPSGGPVAQATCGKDL